MLNDATRKLPSGGGVVVIGTESVVCTWEHAHFERVYPEVLSPGATSVFYVVTDGMQSLTFVYSVD